MTIMTDPQIARIGPPSASLEDVDVYTKFYQRLDRACCESKQGMFKIKCKKGTDKIL